MTRSPEPARPPESRSPARPESKRLRVGVIFGGRSGEHEVSLASAASVLAAIDTTRYDVIPMGITRDGQWLIGGDPLRALAEAAGVRSRCHRASRRPGRDPVRRSPAWRPPAGCRPGRPRAWTSCSPGPRPVRRGRHAPGPPRAGRRPLRGRRGHGLGRRDGQGGHEGRVPGARPPGRPVPRRAGPRVARRAGRLAAARRRRARLPLLRQARQPRLERRHLEGDGGARPRRRRGDRLRPRPEDPGRARRAGAGDRGERARQRRAGGLGPRRGAARARLVRLRGQVHRRDREAPHPGPRVPGSDRGVPPPGGRGLPGDRRGGPLARGLLPRHRRPHLGERDQHDPGVHPLLGLPAALGGERPPLPRARGPSDRARRRAPCPQAAACHPGAHPGTEPGGGA